MPTPRAVVFDIGNVLIEWQPERLYDAEIGPERRRALFAQVDLDAMNLAVDRGAPFTETIHAMAARHPGWAAEIRLWHDRWIDMCQPVIARSVRVLLALRARGIPVFSLSNFGIQSFDLAARHYPFLHAFDRQFLSGHMGVLKPEPEIYARLEAATGLSGAALLFTDDRAANIAAAQDRGWQTHLFEGPDGWADRLVAAGLLHKDEAE